MSRTWREEDSAGINDDNIETIKIEANRLIVRKIMTEIKTWEKQNGFVKEAFEQLTSLISTECQVLDKEVDQVQSILSENSIEASSYIDGQLLYSMSCLTLRT